MTGVAQAGGLSSRAGLPKRGAVSSGSPRLWLAAALISALAGCQCGPDLGPGEDGGVDAGSKYDAGKPPDKPDASAQGIPPEDWNHLYAAEPCPADVFSTPDGGWSYVNDAGVFRFGICIQLHTLTASAFLDGQPETQPIETHFIGAGFESQIKLAPDSTGLLAIKVMRQKYDLLHHQPGGVWPNFKGYLEHGYTDMTKDQTRDFSAFSHTLRGGVHFGGLPFVPNTFPQDVWFNGFGEPAWQMSMVSSAGGSYELKLLEGDFGLYLSTPAVSLYGTELRDFNVRPGQNVSLYADTELDIDIPTSVLEATVTLDGKPVPDARPGPDFSLSYARSGDSTTSVISHHEGGTANITSLVPKARYGISLDFDGVADRTYPKTISGLTAGAGIDLTSDNTFNVDFPMLPIEGGILIDGVPPPGNPFITLDMFMFARADDTSGHGFLFYSIPFNSASFNIRAPKDLYFVVVKLDASLAPSLASGYWVVQRYFEHYQADTMPISINTSRLTGRIKVDGQLPATNRATGTLYFQNRALEGQWSWFQAGVTPSEDGSYEVRLPKGLYTVYFELDPGAYPTYASGRWLVADLVDLSEDAQFDINYNTVELSGPLRVGGQPVADVGPGYEVGMYFQYRRARLMWQFPGGTDEYTVRIPAEDYEMSFFINENAIDGVAWGEAPMGFTMNLFPGSTRPFLNFIDR